MRVDVYGLRSGRRTGTFSAGGWLARLHNTPLRWLGDERILAHWSAGTNVAEAELYDLGGSELLAVSADAIRVSRSNDFLVAWSPVGAPGSEAGNLRLFDLTGRSEAERSVSIPPDARGALPIEDVLFDGGTLVVLVSSDAEELARAIRIPLRT